MTAEKQSDISELRAEIAELRALLKLSIKRKSPRRRSTDPNAPPPADERRAQIRAKVLGKLGSRRKR